MAVAKQPLHIRELQRGLRSLFCTDQQGGGGAAEGFGSGGMHHCWARRISFSVRTSGWFFLEPEAHPRGGTSPQKGAPVSQVGRHTCVQCTPSRRRRRLRGGCRDSFAHFSFTLLVASTGRWKTRGKSRPVKVTFHDNIFEASGTSPRMSFTGTR